MKRPRRQVFEILSALAILTTTATTDTGVANDDTLAADLPYVDLATGILKASVNAFVDDKSNPAGKREIMFHFDPSLPPYRSPADAAGSEQIPMLPQHEGGEEEVQDRGVKLENEGGRVPPEDIITDGGGEIHAKSPSEALAKYAVIKQKETDGGLGTIEEQEPSRTQNEASELSKSGEGNIHDISGRIGDGRLEETYPNSGSTSSTTRYIANNNEDVTPSNTIERKSEDHKDKTSNGEGERDNVDEDQEIVIEDVKQFSDEPRTNSDKGGIDTFQPVLSTLSVDESTTIPNEEAAPSNATKVNSEKQDTVSNEEGKLPRTDEEVAIGDDNRSLDENVSNDVNINLTEPEVPFKKMESVDEGGEAIDVRNHSPREDRVEGDHEGMIGNFSMPLKSSTFDNPNRDLELDADNITVEVYQEEIAQLNIDEVDMQSSHNSKRVGGVFATVQTEETTRSPAVNDDSSYVNNAYGATAIDNTNYRSDTNTPDFVYTERSKSIIANGSGGRGLDDPDGTNGYYDDFMQDRISTLARVEINNKDEKRNSVLEEMILAQSDLKETEGHVLENSQVAALVDGGKAERSKYKVENEEMHVPIKDPSPALNEGNTRDKFPGEVTAPSKSPTVQATVTSDDKHDALDILTEGDRDKESIPSDQDTGDDKSPTLTARNGMPSSSRINTEFIDGIDDLDKFIETVDPPDELFWGTSMQEVLMAKSVQILVMRFKKVSKHIRSTSSNLKAGLMRSNIVQKLSNAIQDSGIADLGERIRDTLSLSEEQESKVSGLKEKCTDLFAHVNESAGKKFEQTKQAYAGWIDGLNNIEVVQQIREFLGIDDENYYDDDDDDLDGDFASLYGVGGEDGDESETNNLSTLKERLAGMRERVGSM